MEKATQVSTINVRDICYISIFTAIIAVMAQISIPLPAGVPLTLQTLAVPLAGIVLGAKRGTISTLVYVLLAMVGVPVLANLAGGIGYVFGITGGFIFSFPIMALVSGLVADKGVKSPVYWLGLLAGVIINYLVGTIWFVFAADSTFMAAVTACVLPFIPTTIMKLVLSGILGDTLRKAMRKANLL
ncbi:biotin transporter BioY [Butyrivibrio sp. AE2032]|uniref:biotin transporter BioY n=1 Tax=Butyrivibrio sp. AE2032 TaxID=1458463 RepID=UPI0005538DBB|nr:biotin transporter BioY [Butyrivibrio sp. AE2032]